MTAPSVTVARSDFRAVAAEVADYADGWAPNELLIGNVRADELAALARSYVELRTVNAALAAEFRNMKEQRDGLVVALSELTRAARGK